MDSQIATSRKRASRHIRPNRPRHMDLTERDLAVVKAVNDYRLMRQDQITRLLFPSKNTAQVRLQLLWQHGYLKRHFLPVALGNPQFGKLLYALDVKGAQLLRRECGYDDDQLRLSKLDQFDQRFLNHTLGLSETRLALETSCRQLGYQLKQWLDEKAMKADYDRVEIRRRLIAILPDAYFVIGRSESTKELHFFIEYDTASENLKFLTQKLRAYWLYLQSHQAKARYGFWDDKGVQIRVLTLVESSQERPSKRLQNLVKLTGGLADTPQDLPWFWFTSTSQLTESDILTSPIWLRPKSPSPLPLINKQR